MEEQPQRKPVKTYANTRKVATKAQLKRLIKSSRPKRKVLIGLRKPLSTKKAVELLIKGTLKRKVCRYCLNIAFPLSDLDQCLSIGGNGALYNVCIRDIVASFHPAKVVDDPNFPNRICPKCINQALQAYLFAQQCEQAERALRNCFDDMYNKMLKLDPLEPMKKRGRQKNKLNHNVLYAEHAKVMDYAEPIRHLINSGSVSLTNESEMTELECKKCWQVLPDVESLANHEKIHPKSMWYHCRLCGQAFTKLFHIRRHLKSKHGNSSQPKAENENFMCRQCGFTSEDYSTHLQHIERHKFKNVMEHLVERKMEELCSVCLDKGSLQNLEKTIRLHGAYPELTGNRSLYNILGSTIPEMNILDNYTGSKICESCLTHAITSYVFINRTHYIRNRLQTCITKMLDNLSEIKDPNGKLFIEIHQNGIVPAIEDNEMDIDDIIANANDKERKVKEDVLEDEFRIKSDSDSDLDDDLNIKAENEKQITSIKADTKTSQVKLVNGLRDAKKTNIKNACSEFLTFKKKPKCVPKSKYTCPVCSKHFISDYFLKKHVLKHAIRNVVCNICDVKFNSKFLLHEHTKVIHLVKKKGYPCNTCGRMFLDVNKLFRHNKTHKTKQCQLCSKVFRTQSNFDSHMQRHCTKLSMLKKESVQTCSFCEKECSNNNTLSVHVNKVHLQIKPFACDMCDRQFYTDSNLKSHKRLHSIPSREKCEICFKMFKCRRDLVIHVRKHLGNKPYRCLVCSKMFYSDSRMNGHMKKWHGGSFGCRLCKKVFVNKRGLEIHTSRAHSVF